MIRQSIGRVWIVAMVVVGLLVSATPAFSQATGGLRGTVVDEAGNPVPDAEIVFKYLGDRDESIYVTANDKGEWLKSGIRTGRYEMTATAGELTGVQNVMVMIQAMTKVDTLVMRTAVVGATDTSGMSEAAVKKENERREAMTAQFETAVASLDSDPAAAIAALTTVAGEFDECAICYARMGDAHVALNDDAAAEAAYKQAIEFDPNLADPYSALSVLYNKQQKYDDATAMSQKANELLAATGVAGDPTSIYNQGIILWNQGGKAAEAKAEFEKVIALDATHAEAQYWLGMASINLGQIPDAVTAFEAYLKLAPDGEFAEMAAGILKQIK